MPYPLERLAGATSRGQTMAPEGQKPSQCLCLTKLPRDMYSQPIVHKALSWGAIRKSAGILAEITIRKSQKESYRGRKNALRLLLCHHGVNISVSLIETLTADQAGSRLRPGILSALRTGKLSLACFLRAPDRGNRLPVELIP
jgi:hypothetical protein